MLEREEDDVFSALPGNALAATSVNIPVSATDPAISHRLTRPSLRSAASLAIIDLGCMYGLWVARSVLS